MHQGNYLPLSTYDIDGARPKQMKGIKNHNLNYNENDYTRNPYLYSKKSANEIWIKNHPDTHNDIFGAMTTKEAIKNQFTHKNGEYATLISYSEHIRKEMERKKEYERQKMANKMNYRNSMAQNDALDQFQSQMQVQNNKNEQPTKPKNNSLTKDVFNFFAMPPPPTGSKERQAYKMEEFSKSKRNVMPQAFSNQAYKIDMNDPQIQEDAYKFYNGTDGLKNHRNQQQKEKSFKNDAATFFEKGTTPKLDAWKNYMHPKPKTEKYNVSASNHIQQYQGNHHFQNQRDKMYKGPQNYNDQVLQSRKGHLQFARDAQPFTSKLNQKTLGDGEMRIQKKKRAPNSSLLYGHSPLYSTDAAKVVPTNRMYGSGIPVLY